MSNDTLAGSGGDCAPGRPCSNDGEGASLNWVVNTTLKPQVTVTSTLASAFEDATLMNNSNVSSTVTTSDNTASYQYVIYYQFNRWNASEGGGNDSTNATYGGESISLSSGAEATLIVFYTLTILFSVIGNILVVIVFTRGRRCRTDIRPFLINLAAADLIMALFCMPFTFTYVMTRTWIFSEPMCPLVLFMQHLSVSASVFTNMAIGIDRFLVVTFPLQARMTSRRARYTICVIWVCAVGLSSVQLVVGRATTHGGITSCDEVWSSHSSRRTFTMLILFITYIIPLVILSVTYSIVSRLLWKRTAPGNAHEDRDLQQLRAKRKVIKMLVLVVIMFGVCWLPLHTFFLVLDFKPELIRADSHLSTVVFYIAFLLAMSNSCANPIIYGFTNDSFRVDLATLCTLWFPFCVCLKRLANRKFSMSTYDSQYNRRFSTFRKGPADSIYRPAGGSGSGGRTGAGADGSVGEALGCRNGSRMYIELRRGLLARERSALSMNDFYRDSLERGVTKKGVHFSSNGEISLTNNNHSTNKVSCKVNGVGGGGRPGIIKNSYSSNSLLRHQCIPSFGPRPPRRLPAFLRSESGDSTKRLTSNRSHESDLGELQFIASSPAPGGDCTPQGSGESPAVTPDSVVLSEFFFSRTASNGSATSKLKCLPENEIAQTECNGI